MTRYINDQGFVFGSLVSGKAALVCAFTKHFDPSQHLWIDPERQLSVTLLTNRTWPDCSNQAIKQLRPKFHDAVVESIAAIQS